MLKWTIAELLRHQTKPLHFEDTLDLAADLQARDPEIIKVSPVKVTGDIVADQGALLVTVTLDGMMVIPSTRSLTPVDWPLDFSFTEIYDQPGFDPEKYDEGQLVLDLPATELDLVPAVADHILLSIPMQVLTPEEAAAGTMPSGQDWTVMGEDEYEAEKDATNGNPAFAKLKGMFDEPTGQDTASGEHPTKHK